MTSEPEDEIEKISESVPTSRRELGTRIAWLLARYKSKKAAAQAAGVSAEQLKSYEDGKAKPSFEVLTKLARPQGVSLDWLATGDPPVHSAEELRHFEESIGPLPHEPLDLRLAKSCLVELEEFLQELEKPVSPQGKAEMFELIYRAELEAAREGKPRPTGAQILRLIKRVA